MAELPQHGPIIVAINDFARVSQQWIGGLLVSSLADPNASGVTLSPEAHPTQCLDVANHQLVLNGCTASASQMFVWQPTGELKLGTLCVDASQGFTTQPAVGIVAACTSAASQMWQWKQGQILEGSALCLIAGDANQVSDTPVALGPCSDASPTWVAGAPTAP